MHCWGDFIQDGKWRGRDISGEGGKEEEKDGRFIIESMLQSPVILLVVSHVPKGMICTVLCGYLLSYIKQFTCTTSVHTVKAADLSANPNLTSSYLQ